MTKSKPSIEALDAYLEKARTLAASLGPGATVMAFDALAERSPEEFIAKYRIVAKAAAALDAAYDMASKLRGLRGDYMQAVHDVFDDLEYIEDIEYEFKTTYDVVVNDIARAQAAKKMLKSKGLRMLTMNDIKNVYVAGKSSYGSSYAMLVDDAYEGAKKAADRVGLPLYHDAGPFPTMMRFIRSHTPWDRVPERFKLDMLEDANEELVRR